MCKVMLTHRKVYFAKVVDCWRCFQNSGKKTAVDAEGAAKKNRYGDKKFKNPLSVAASFSVYDPTVVQQIYESSNRRWTVG